MAVGILERYFNRTHGTYLAIGKIQFFGYVHDLTRSHHFIVIGISATYLLW